MIHNFSIAIAAENVSVEKKAADLSHELQLPIVELDSKKYACLLIVTTEKLILKNTQAKNSKAIEIDFLSAKHKYRQRNNQRELLKKALGTLAPSSLIVDATAGFGGDAFMLASKGYRVMMIERSAILAALLRDGLARLYLSLNDPQLISLELIHEDAMTYLPRLAKETAIDVVYLDPMFPERKKSALSCKEMEILRKLIGKDTDAGNLLQVALKVAKNRVIVKRPRLADALGNMKPTFSLTGKVSRFDVYVTSI